VRTFLFYTSSCFGNGVSLDTPEQLENRSRNAPLLRYVDSVRTHGHRAARVDPLDLMQREEEVAALNPRRYGLLSDSETYDVDGILWTTPLDSATKPEPRTLGEITRHLRATYVGRIAVEYMHSPSKTERLWFAHLLESSQALETTSPVTEDEKKRIHELLAKSETFDRFLQTKFPNLKRYGLEGGESMLPALDTLFRVAAGGSYFRRCS
jgi:probable 2-oxoglutarate dehydrogenase E1 component DHKTD1